jgi:flagellar biosynthesis GTPase FlhF
MGLWTLMAPFALMALGTGLQVGTPDPSERTAIEQALIEYVCGGMPPSGPGETDAYHECLVAQLLQLRADFGRDLSRLSSVERRTLDSACSKIREARGREAYVACLNAQLVSLRSRRKPASPAPSDATAPSPSPTAPPEVAAPPARHRSLRSSAVWIGTGLGAALVAAGGVLLAVKARRAGRQCRVCGGVVSDLGDMCQTCRHEAAESVRRAAAARADEQRAQEDERRQKRQREEEQVRQRSRREEEARQEQEEEAHQREELGKREEEGRLRQDEAAHQRDEAARQSGQPAIAQEDLFDPYAVLGVPREASAEAILAAYREAKAKYDPDLVAHLSNELQEHYKEKAEAVDRAYQRLTT